MSSAAPDAPMLSADVVPTFTRLPHNRAIVLRNITCAYCGRNFDAELKSTKEHVIGRRFVPRGCFDGQWNLILNACEPCNNDKADLEDDISVITMMPDQVGRYAVNDDRLRAEVTRKGAKSRSRRTGRAVVDSQEKIEIKGQFGSSTFTFKFVAPAQADEIRLFRLAHYQFRGFFYWITYNAESRKGGFMLGGFYPLLVVRRADWGTPHMRWFMDLVGGWELRVHAIAADGFCKLLIRKNPDAHIWCWAMEWNQAHRIVGFAGDGVAIDALILTMPARSIDVVYQSETELIQVRSEIALSEDEDDLFAALVEFEDLDGTYNKLSSDGTAP